MLADRLFSVDAVKEFKWHAVRRGGIIKSSSGCSIRSLNYGPLATDAAAASLQPQASFPINWIEAVKS